MTKISPGTIHSEIPTDMKKALSSNKETLKIWESLTPLARNEFICWITIPKKEETRVKRIDWMLSNLSEGKRRPCCWPGCSHRNENTKKYFK